MLSNRLFSRTTKFICFKCRRSCTTSTKEWTERIFSGIQPTGTLHLGNYLGAVKNWVDLQNTTGNFMCSVVNLHATTCRYNVQKLPENVFMMVASLLACGIDPNKSTMFLQSEVHEHTQLFWVLACICTSARLARMTQYREKSSHLLDAGLGLYAYPVLQAADILLYQATKVPVGIDQVQHLQLTNELVRKFNHVFGETFPVPETIIMDGGGSKIKDLRDPTRKMSKSSISPRGRLEITDSSDVILSKIKKAVTDCKSVVSYDPNERPGVSNLISMHAVLSNRTPEEICHEARHLNTGQYKLKVAEVVIETMNPIREELHKLLKDKAYLTTILKEGNNLASSIASKTWKLVKEKTGLVMNVD